MPWEYLYNAVVSVWETFLACHTKLNAIHEGIVKYVPVVVLKLQARFGVCSLLIEELTKLVYE